LGNLSGTWERFTYIPPPPLKNKQIIKACMESGLSTVQEESEQWTIHSPNLKIKNHPSPPTLTREKGRPSHSMTQLLIGCIEILFIKLAATSFGLD